MRGSLVVIMGQLHPTGILFMKRSVIIHPFLFTTVAVLFLYIRVSTTIAPTEIFRPLFWMIVLLAALSIPLYKIIKDWEKTGFVLSFFAFIFYFEQVIFIATFSLTVILIVLWVLYTKTIRKRKVKLSEVTALLNILSFAFVLGGSLKLISLLAKVPTEYYQDFFPTPKQELLAKATPRQENPDIYYIILDGYGRADVLKEFFAFDNAEFINQIKKKGFTIPEANHSNYPKTTFSIASTLNMDYVHNLTPNLEKSYFWWLMSPLIQHNQTRIMLEDMGYQSIALGVDWTITDNQTTDIYYSPSPIKIREFENHLISQSALKAIRPLLNQIAYVPNSYDGHREIILYNFEKLPEIPNLPGDYFVYVHFLAPHPPFVFDENGKSIDPDVKFSFNDDDSFTEEQQRIKNYRTGYSEQARFLNKKILTVIEEILEKSSIPPIIILQADHGSGMYVDFASAEKTCLRERFSPFAAYYLPEMQNDAIPDDITPVNLFRIIFNEYFETNLPLLENTYYFSKDPAYLYQMEEISLQEIESDCTITP